MQLAAFLPVARIYGSDTYQAVDGTVKPNPQADISEFQFSTKFMMTSNIQYKLQWSRYTYTQLFRVSQEGGSIIRPLFFEYPRDDVALSNIDNSFMTGDAILVIPSLDESNAAYKGYLPKGRWVGLYNSQIIASTGALIDLTPHEAYAYAFLRPGKIVPFQINDKSARTTADFHTLL
jgi:alpha-glucosidase (family GH31 glycosyl hydrolase)